ncbi:DUF3892 domain-containing protein [Hyphomonas jannaschiana]|uniref:DUF3892 domain-containing protein n=1 Tax=Hyphomonas jannaschiana TaxID=86 RepID=UPI0012DC41C9
MARLVITGCVADGADADRTIDVVYGDGFRLRMDKAVELALAGVEFWAKMPGITIARVRVQKSVSGNYYLRTHPDAWVANNLGKICSTNRASKLASANSLASGFSYGLTRQRTDRNALANASKRSPFLSSLTRDL